MTGRGRPSAALRDYSGGFRFYDVVMNDRCLIESATACGMDKA